MASEYHLLRTCSLEEPSCQAQVKDPRPEQERTEIDRLRLCTYILSVQVLINLELRPTNHQFQFQYRECSGRSLEQGFGKKGSSVPNQGYNGGYGIFAAIGTGV